MVVVAAGVETGVVSSEPESVVVEDSASVAVGAGVAAELEPVSEVVVEVTVVLAGVDAGVEYALEPVLELVASVPVGCEPPVVELVVCVVCVASEPPP